MHIRKYCEGDRETVRRICCETGFLGNPIDTIYTDTELFADLFTDPYLEYEPGWALVAEVDGQVVGYLLGSANSHFSLTLMCCGLNTLTRMIFRLVTGRYNDHPRSKQFVRWVVAKGLKEQPKHPGNAAHLHFNLKKGFRGKMIAKQLWLTYEEMVKSASISRYYGKFFSYGRHRPELVYPRYGFKIFDRCETTMYQPEIQDAVHVVCVFKSLTTPELDAR
ncbi:MAG: hypothetical protein P8175_01535 [Deltaproteobacteria bacterium]